MTDRFPATVMLTADDVRQLSRLQIQTERLWSKFHIETDCGLDGVHWAECEAVADALGLGDFAKEEVQT